MLLSFVEMTFVEATVRFPGGCPESWRQGWEGPCRLNMPMSVLSVAQEDLLRLSELLEGRSC